MANIAQLALKAFEDGWITVNYAGKTAAQKTTYIQQHYGLKVDAAKEIEANRIADEAEAETHRLQRRQQAITYLTNHGFVCDDSLIDWQRLYNHPRIFGANWNEQAVYQKSISTGVDYFLNIAYQLWQEYIQNR